MNYVYLDNKHNEFYVGDEAYGQITALVMANKYCMYDYRDRHPYTESNPCVGRNICLEHLLQKQRNLTQLQIVGVDGTRSMYYFVDEKGYLYTSVEDSSEEARRDIMETLSFYGYQPPKSIEARGKMVDFYSHYATLHGDLRYASVIVMSYQQSSEKIKALFLLYKGNPAVELHKRGDHKALYARAEALVEATKDKNNEYHVGGNAHYGRYESDVYEVISQLETATYNVIRSFQNGKEEAHEEPVQQDTEA